MARTSNLANVATVTRASKAWDPLWDFTSGGTVGTLTEYASGVARVGTNGLLVEEASTNQIRNPRLEGATAGDLGSSGALPTNLSFASGGMTWTVDGVGTEDGREYLQITLSGTKSSDAALYLENNSQIVAADGEDWTFSHDIKIISGSMPGIPRMVIFEATSVGGFVTSGVRDYATDVALDSNLRRYAFSRTLSGGGTVARTYPAFYLSGGSGAVACTFRIYGPQFEKKAYPTSPILPVVASPAASTRAADQIGVTTGAWFGATAHTMYAEFMPNAPGSFDYFVSFDDNNWPTDAFAIGVSSSQTARVLVNDGGAAQVSAAIGTFALNTTSKIAFALAANNAAWSKNGETQGTDTSCTVPALSSLTFGFAATPYPSVYYKDFRYWPRRLSNAELEALVGN